MNRNLGWLLAGILLVVVLLFIVAREHHRRRNSIIITPPHIEIPDCPDGRCPPKNPWRP